MMHGTMNIKFQILVSAYNDKAVFGKSGVLLFLFNHFILEFTVA
jgi:hypothetical protein